MNCFYKWDDVQNVPGFFVLFLTLKKIRNPFTHGLVPENLKPEPEKIVLNPNTKINIHLKPQIDPTRLFATQHQHFYYLLYCIFYEFKPSSSSSVHCFFLSALPPYPILSLIALTHQGGTGR